MLEGAVILWAPVLFLLLGAAGAVLGLLVNRLVNMLKGAVRDNHH